MAILEVQDIHTYYGDAYVLQGLSLQLEQGQILGLLGRNGVGKTTTLSALTGRIPLSAGEISFAGERIDTCLFVGPAHDAGDWNVVKSLFAVDALTGDQRRMVQGMDQFPQARRPETVVPGQERLGRSLVGGLPRTHLHRATLSAWSRPSRMRSSPYSYSLP